MHLLFDVVSDPNAGSEAGLAARRGHVHSELGHLVRLQDIEVSSGVKEGERRFLLRGHIKTYDGPQVLKGGFPFNPKNLKIRRTCLYLLLLSIHSNCSNPFAVLQMEKNNCSL